MRAGEDSYEAGVAAVLFIRCMKHRDVPQLNSNEHSGGECGVCVRQEIVDETLDTRMELNLADEYVGSALKFLDEGEEYEARQVLRNWLNDNKSQRADSGTGTPEAETVGSEPERSPATDIDERIEALRKQWDWAQGKWTFEHEALSLIEELRAENQTLSDVVAAAWSWLDWRVAWGGVPGRSPVEKALLSALVALEKDKG